MSFLAKSPIFWRRERKTFIACLLWPIGVLVGGVTGRRMLRNPRARASVPVVCIGNFVVGGVGKTPFILMLAGMMKARGRAPVFLSRGFGGRLKGPVLVDPSVHNAGDVGDEALLLAAQGPTVVSADRGAGARLAQGLGDLILMDDGFQNPVLHKDYSIVLVDGETGIGNGLCLPAGPLRARPEVQILKTDHLVVVGEGKRADSMARLAQNKGVPVSSAYLSASANQSLVGAQVLAFAGIGRPEKLFKTIEALGGEIVARRSFADHHPYSPADAAALLSLAQERNLQLITTSKDMARLKRVEEEALRRLASVTRVVDVEMRLEDEQSFLAHIDGILKA